MRGDGCDQHCLASQAVRGPFRTHGLRFIPETGFDLHCLAELAVQLAKFSALAAERGCFAIRHKRLLDRQRQEVSYHGRIALGP